MDLAGHPIGMNRSPSVTDRSAAGVFGNDRDWGLELDLMDPVSSLSKYKRLAVAAGWVLVVTIFASQWYLYDWVHHDAERFTYYLATSAYLWGVLTPFVFWLARRQPLASGSWKRAVSLHVLASVGLTVLGVCIEATVGWLPHRDEWRLQEAFRHYFAQHTQISLVTYWVLLAAAYAYRIYDQSRRRDLQTAQLEAQLADAKLATLRSQLQPHFLFNTLQAATILIYDDPQGAEEILLSLSELLRISVEALQEQEVALSQEIYFLKHYAAIQQRRFGGRLEFEFKVEDELGGYAVPSMALQPLAENAIRHGIGKHKEPDVVTIRAFKGSGRLCLEVYNQTSVLENAPDQPLRQGLGLSNTQARLAQLYGSEHSFEIRNLEPRGVVVRLSIPLRAAATPVCELAGEVVR